MSDPYQSSLAPDSWFSAVTDFPSRVTPSDFRCRCTLGAVRWLALRSSIVLRSDHAHPIRADIQHTSGQPNRRQPIRRWADSPQSLAGSTLSDPYRVSGPGSVKLTRRHSYRPAWMHRPERSISEPCESGTPTERGIRGRDRCLGLLIGPLRPESRGDTTTLLRNSRPQPDTATHPREPTAATFFGDACK